MKSTHFLAILKMSIVWFILSFTFDVYARDSADTLSELLKSMHSLKADFIQTTYDQKGKAIQRSKGTMLLQRPNQFRWDVVTPNKQLIVTNGKRLWLYEPDLEQVTIRSLVKTAGETPALLLSDETLSLAREFVVRSVNGGPQHQQFLLTPKDKSSMISELKLRFTHQQIDEMHLQDHLGHTTKIEFTHVKMNTFIPQSLFAFKPPAHVDIIDDVKQRSVER